MDCNSVDFCNSCLVNRHNYDLCEGIARIIEI
nr:MAG TPA: hypothetical protein [Caudoviricetes sp.]